MNKLLKLPLFLGIAGAACGGVLAGVNALTAPVIAENAEKAANQAYYDTFAEFGAELDIDKTLTINDTLKDAGVKTKASVKAEGLEGIVYSCTVTGAATAGGNDLSFQVAFANGNYYGYTTISQKESAGYGEKTFDYLTNYLPGLDASTTIEKPSAVSGASQTWNAVADAIKVCAEDYVANHKQTTQGGH